MASWRCLAVGVLAHLAGLAAYAHRVGQLPLTGLGPSLSFAGLVLAATLLLVEAVARDVSLTLVAAPLAAVPTICATLIGFAPGVEPPGARGAWLFAHIALSFLGIAAFATAAAAGCMYLVERRELKSRRFGAIYRFFPPLATLDRVNHVAAIAGWLGLTLGVVLAVTYSVAYRELSLPKVIWATGAWLAVSGDRPRPRGRRVAGSARGDLLERLVRRRRRALRRVPRGRVERRRTVPVSGFPLLVEGAALPVLVVGGGRGGGAQGEHARRVGRAGARGRALGDAGDARARRRRTRRARRAAVRDARTSATRSSSSPRRAIARRTRRVADDARRRTDWSTSPTRRTRGRSPHMATHRAGHLVVGVSAGGVPGAAARIRDAIAERFDGRYAAALELLGALRRSHLARGDGGTWRALSSSAVDERFCDSVEQGTLDDRVATWR